jgi:hypothetical protein
MHVKYSQNKLTLTFQNMHIDTDFLKEHIPYFFETVQNFDLKM